MQRHLDMSTESTSHAMLPEYTLVEILRWRASFTPDDIPFRFFREGAQETSRISYREFHDAANKIAAFLCARGKIGQPVLLLYPEGIEFAVALLGCMIAGSLAVPIPAPDYNTLRRTRERLVNITNHTGASLLFTSIVENDEHLYAELAASDSQVEWVLHSAVVFDQRPSPSTLAQCPSPGMDTIAFIQFTSGSTGSPKGISISHGNLVHQLSAFACSGQYEPNSLIVNWMPHFHDFGLIYGILFPLFVGIQCLTMPPIAFLRRPIRWLQLISDHKATHSAAPNFAYDYCCRTVSKREIVGLDFTTWRAALVGAEPIDPSMMRRFSTLVKDAGFDLHNFCPGYGLAESTLGVTLSRQWDSPLLYEVDAAGLLEGDVRTASVDGGLSRTIVGCGRPIGSDTRVLIVDPLTLTICAQDKVGEVWVASASVAIGYWRSAQETAETFQAHLANGDGPFLRTGDLGFFYNGELFITGRLKELIIIGGQNYYPQDIERTAESSHSALRPQSCAAFSVTNGARESVILIVEARVKAQRFSEVMASIRNAVSLSHGLDISRIVLTKPGCVPKTSSGKLQRRKCRQILLEGAIEILAEDTADVASFATHPAAPAEDIAQVAPLDELRLSYEEVSSILRASISSLLGIDPASINEHRPFAEYGLASLHIIRACTTIEKKLGRPISPVLLFEHPTLQLLSKALCRVDDTTVNEAPALSSPLGEPIAIIGLGCRFPGASTPEQFWQLLISGGQSIDVVPSDRWNLERFYSAGAFGPRQMNTRFGGFLNDVDLFDRRLFGISKPEAVHMDPQQRILLEVVWEALEDAGVDSKKLAKTATGVFIGICNSDYRLRLYGASEGISPYAGPGGALSIAANRISYVFDLLGPSVAVDTACSSSLVALHLACQSLRSSESDAAVVGGVNLILAPEPTVAFSQAGMMSPDGRCKTFDTKANGYVRSEGCGVVILRRLSSALRNGDRIIALIHGSAVNQDGHSNGLTAPSPSAQRDVMLRAFKNAKVQPFDIGYIEAHGTGTALGDVIEMDSIINVAGRKVEGKGKCFVGSVKANIGHLEAAAGIAGVLKIALMFENGMISPHINLDELNPKIQLEGTRIEIPREPLSWPGTSALMAGVSSFGFGGTNSHVVMGPGPARQSADPAVESQLQLLTLSTETHAALLDLAHRYVCFLDQDSESFADVCFTANTGRARLSHRIALIANSGPEAAGVLRHFIDGVQCDALFSGPTVERTPDIHLHCDGIERDLSPELLAVLPCLGVYHHGIKRMLGPQFARSWATGFAAEYALVQMWKHLGVTPSRFSGDGIGRLLAECLSSRRSISEAVHSGIATSRFGFSGGGATKCADSRRQKLNIPANCSVRDFLSTAAQLFVLGVNVDLLEVRPAGRSRVRLPAYPFQRERYWISKHDTEHDL